MWALLTLSEHLRNFLSASLPLEQSDLNATVPFPHPFLTELATPLYHEHQLFDVLPLRALGELQEHPEVPSISAKHILRVKAQINLSHLLAWPVRVLDAVHLRQLGRSISLSKSLKPTFLRKVFSVNAITAHGILSL